MSGLLCGAATSQVISSQVQLGDVFTEQTLNVVDVSDAVTLNSAATGNVLSGANADRADVSLDARQEVQGAINSHGVLDASGAMGQTTALSVTAVGNSVNSDMQGGAVTATVNQYAGPAGVLARGQTEAAEGGATDFTDNTMAVNNSYNVGLTNAAAGVRLVQTTDGQAFADGGAIIGDVASSANMASNAAGNTASLAGVSNSALRIVADQTNNADLVQASKFAAYGSSYVTNTSASAIANTLTATNEGGLADVDSVQTNSAYVRAQAEETSAAFSAGTASAYGVGNSLMAGTIGGDLILNNVQNNSVGGVEAVANFSGGAGYDGVASATAMGNTATGYACSDCSSSLRATNSQINSADVAATANMAATGPSRSAFGSATAIGNNASYYVNTASRAQ